MTSTPLLTAHSSSSSTLYQEQQAKLENELVSIAPSNPFSGECQQFKKTCSAIVRIYHQTNQELLNFYKTHTKQTCCFFWGRSKDSDFIQDLGTNYPKWAQSYKNLEGVLEKISGIEKLLQRDQFQRTVELLNQWSSPDPLIALPEKSLAFKQECTLLWSAFDQIKETARQTFNNMVVLHNQLDDLYPQSLSDKGTEREYTYTFENNSFSLKIFSNLSIAVSRTPAPGSLPKADLLNLAPSEDFLTHYQTHFSQLKQDSLEFVSACQLQYIETGQGKKSRKPVSYTSGYTLRLVLRHSPGDSWIPAMDDIGD